MAVHYECMHPYMRAYTELYGPDLDSKRGGVRGGGGWQWWWVLSVSE